MRNLNAVLGVLGDFVRNLNVTFRKTAFRLSIFRLTAVRFWVEGKKVFSNDKRYIKNTIYDIIELQNGDLILSDVPHGRVYYRLTMYGYEWEIIYTITEIGFETAK